MFVNVRFEVLTTGSMKMTVFWYVGLCSVVEIGQHIKEALSISETSVSFYQTYTEQCPRTQAILRSVVLCIAAVRNGGLIVGNVFIDLPCG
jgi:hypothetical protein